MVMQAFDPSVWRAEAHLLFPLQRAHSFHVMMRLSTVDALQIESTVSYMCCLIRVHTASGIAPTFAELSWQQLKSFWAK